MHFKYFGVTTSSSWRVPYSETMIKKLHCSRKKCNNYQTAGIYGQTHNLLSYTDFAPAI